MQLALYVQYVQGVSCVSYSSALAALAGPCYCVCCGTLSARDTDAPPPHGEAAQSQLASCRCRRPRPRGHAAQQRKLCAATSRNVRFGSIVWSE
eukprot:6188419-Pleurochrysis_carterae.AAC.8